MYYKNKVANERQNLTFCFGAFVGRRRNANAPTGVIEITLWREVEKAELEEELNEPVTDVEPTAEAPVQESIVEPRNPEAADVVENNLTAFNLKKAGKPRQASLSKQRPQIGTQRLADTHVQRHVD